MRTSRTHMALAAGMALMASMPSAGPAYGESFGHSAAFDAWKPKLDLREQTPGARANRRNRHKKKAGAQ